MNVVVAGHLVLDEIHVLSGEVHESLGGISFPLFTFSALADGNTQIIPVFSLGRDAREAYERTCRLHPRIVDTGVFAVDQPSTRVQLFQDSLSHYNTRLVESHPPIPFERLEPFLDIADLVYVNMMTREDVSAETLRQIRQSTDGMLYIDVHMLAYGVHSDGARYIESVARWKSWIEHADIVQCNEREFAALIPGATDDEERASTAFAETGIREFVVTRGEAGADIYSRASELIHISAQLHPDPVDPTGCGDAFGSTYAYYRTKGLDIQEAGALAAQAAAFIVGIPGSKGIENLKEHIR